MKTLELHNLTEEQIKSLEDQIKAYREKNKTPETLEECYNKVKPAFYINANNTIGECSFFTYIDEEANQLPSKNHCKQLQAIMKEMVVAEALNDGWWEPIWDHKTMGTNEKWWIYVADGKITATVKNSYSTDGSTCYPSEKNALKAIEILGKETIKQARGIFD